MTQDTKHILSKLAIEYWRIARSYERNLLSMQNPSSAAGTIRNSEKKFVSILLENGLRFMNYEGQDYSPNLPITVVNHDEFSDGDDLVISQMVEPTILCDENVINMGKAILSRKAG